VSDERITIADCRAHGYCMRGVREFCAVSGHSFPDFIRDGIALDAARALNDARLNVLIAYVEARRG
jgi:hypothetical protein